MNWRTLSGYGLLIIGIAGCLLPIVPGFPFLIAAAAILGWDHWAIKPWAQRLQRFRPGAASESSSPPPKSPPAQ